MEKSDAQLLREYAVGNSEAAFAELVQRHADLVYSAAWRQVQSADGAAEIAQRVFIDLARKARPLSGQVRENGSVAAWLFRATRFAALAFLREERRRHLRERQAMQDFQPDSESNPDWNQLAPLLDEAISGLNEQEREALLLRFFKNLDFHAVGAALGVSDDTAQKRVARSLHKLRIALARRGLTTTAAALSAALMTNAVKAAPVGAATAWIGVSLAGAGAKTGTTFTLLKIMSMTKIQFGLGALVLGGLTITATLQYQAAHKSGDENQALRQQVAKLTADNQALANRVPPPEVAPATQGDQLRELARLRAEVGKLRDTTNALRKLREQNTHLEARAEKSEETLQFEGISARTVNDAKMIGVAARIWAGANTNVFPTNLLHMSNELGGDARQILQMHTAFELINVGRADIKYPAAIFARERVPRANPTGGWQRIYLLCDGSVQTATLADGNFDNWEQNNTTPVPAPGQ